MSSLPPGSPGSAAGAAAPGSDIPRVSLLDNPISLVGFFFVGLGLVLILTYAAFAVVSDQENPYLDIVGYMILPGIFVSGLVIVPVGMLWKLLWLRRHAARYRLSFRLPTLDLNNPRLRRRVFAFVLFNLFVVLPVLAITSYEGYHYTESTRFCGQTCHSVMEPQATAHLNSPHARVTCAECHIGAGADWFVKSKLSGVRQVFAVLFETYHRPIPPAITALRPARDTCEECHWPAKFYGWQYKENVHYSPDEQNTRRPVRMLLKVGGADESIGRVEGIHMHMLVSGKIEYVATDPHLQVIPWVRYTMASGEVRVFRSDGRPADAPPPPGLMRTIDCMDCHNRGAHHFRTPQAAVDLFLNVDRIDPTLPYIKREAVRALTANYPDRAAAAQEIGRRLTEFYQREYPDVWNTRRAAVEQAVESVREIYARNFFPRMKVDWRTYPENVGHLNSPGCFRCHDGLHIDAAGTPISSTCETCHVFLNPIPGRPEEFAIGPFQHSMDLTLHSNLRCNECHSGGELRLCRDCHQSPDWADKYGQGQFRPTSPLP